MTQPPPPPLGDPPQPPPPAPPAPVQIITPPAKTDWTNNRLIVGVGLLLAGLLGSAATGWWNMSSKSQTLEFQQKAHHESIDALKKDVAEQRVILDNLKSNLQSSYQASLDHVGEIAALKMQVSAAEQTLAKYETAINGDSSRIDRLENVRETHTADFASVRERLGKVEGYLDAKKEPAK